jgi:hypothetical protein
MIWFVIARLACLAVFLELAHRAPVIPDDEEL